MTPLNSILIFRCYTSSSKEKRDKVKRAQGIRLIDKDVEAIYNERRYIWEKKEARGDLAAVKLTTSTGYSQKVEFSTNLFGLPFQACPHGQQKIGRPKARKEVGLSGNV
jgi:hypothetical protein